MLGLQSLDKPPDQMQSTEAAPTLPALSKALKEFSRYDVREFENDEIARFFQAARLLIQNQEYTSAQRLLREVLNLAPYSSAAIFALAECAAHLRQDAERLQLLKTLVAIDDHPQHLLALADVLYEKGMDQEALKYYLQALNLLPDDSVALFQVYKNVGNIYVRTHDFDSAEEYYNRAYPLNPSSATLLVNFGTLSIQREEWDLALQRFREAVQLDSKFDRAWVGLALVHRHYSDFDLSWANLAKALDLNPLNTTALQLALSWVEKDQRWQQVTDALLRYLEFNDQDSLISLALSQLWYLQGRFKEAKIELTRALALDPCLQGGDELLRLIEAEINKHAHGWENELRENRSTHCPIG